jgi:hypothetical protein
LGNTIREEFRMRDRVRNFLSNGASRRALMTAGAVIAGAYLGFAFPGGVEAIHEAFQYAVTLNPFTDPAAQITALYEGAQYQAAAALHSVGDWFQSVGVELTLRAREDIERARLFIGPALDHAKALFLEVWQPVTTGAIMLRDQIRNAIPDPQAALVWTKEVGSAAVDLVRSAAEAYGVYDLAKKAYGRLFSRARAEVRDEMGATPDEPATVTERTISLNLNTAVGGGAVADAALRSREIRVTPAQDPTRGLSALGSDQIIWLSDQFTRRISTDLDDLIADVEGSGERVSLLSASPVRLEDAVNPVEDLRHRARFPTINWGESDLSASRLDRLRCGSRIGGETLKGQSPIRSDLKIVLGEDGFLRAERKKDASAPSDLVM